MTTVLDARARDIDIYVPPCSDFRLLS
jgi:hypothetical protein